MKKVLLTGATGYIGRRLLPVLLEHNYSVVCCVRDPLKFEFPTVEYTHRIKVVTVDFLKEETLNHLPKDVDGAYYLMHSMSSFKDYEKKEVICAKNFKKYLSSASCEHVVYLTGIINKSWLSKHLKSRFSVEKVLREGNYHFTALRAGIIIGSGSASFEIIRDIVEKLPIMVAPKWLHTKCQPIGIVNVLDFLIKTLFNSKTYDHYFDIGCPDVLSYKNMLLGYAQIRGLKRSIFIIPVMTPRLSSYWLYFVTSTTYKLACSLVDSMKVEVICHPDKLEQIMKITGILPFDYQTALKRTLFKIAHMKNISDDLSQPKNDGFSDFVEVPKYGCFVDCRKKTFDNRDRCIDRVFSIGGDKGWYYANFLWKIRGWMDKRVGGVGLRRGRIHPTRLHAGDTIDFWRVLYADKQEGKLVLFAEMKLPGEAWLEFKIIKNQLQQKAVFRAKGLIGRLYWYLVTPFHSIVFKGMLHYLTQGK